MARLVYHGEHEAGIPDGTKLIGTRTSCASEALRARPAHRMRRGAADAFHTKVRRNEMLALGGSGNAGRVAG